MAEVRLGVWGAAGRLGSRIVQLASSSPAVRITAALERAGSPLLGQPVQGGPEGLRYAAEESSLDGCDVMVDVSLAEGVVKHARAAEKASRPLLMAVTGLKQDALDEIRDCGGRIPVCIAPNLSAGVWVLSHLVAEAARVLAEYDIEIVETHHKHKRDAPSGTALLLARSAAAGRGVELESVLDTSRTSEPKLRASGSIGVAAVRGGDVVGDHTVYVIGEGERLELTHRAHSRDTFARGALVLVQKLVGKPAGVHAVPDLLGLGTR